MRMRGHDEIGGATSMGGGSGLGMNEVLATRNLHASSIWSSTALWWHHSPSKWMEKGCRCPFKPSPIHLPHFRHSFSNRVSVPGQMRVGELMTAEFRFQIASWFVGSDASKSSTKVILMGDCGGLDEQHGACPTVAQKQPISTMTVLWSSHPQVQVSPLHWQTMFLYCFTQIIFE